MKTPVVGLMIKSLIHFVVVFVHGVEKGSHFILLYVDIQTSLPVKDQIVNILDFIGHPIFATTTQLYYWSRNTVIDNM